MSVQINYVIELDGDMIGNALAEADDPRQIGNDITARIASEDVAVAFAAGAFDGLSVEAGEAFGSRLANDWHLDVLEPLLRGLLEAFDDEQWALAERLLAAERDKRAGLSAPAAAFEGADEDPAYVAEAHAGDPV